MRGGRTLTFDCIVLTTKTFVPDNKLKFNNNSKLFMFY